jgi:hypothetical protein
VKQFLSLHSPKLYSRSLEAEWCFAAAFGSIPQVRLSSNQEEAFISFEIQKISLALIEEPCSLQGSK